ncbi:MAG: methylenetetrahydrofolate reductase [Pseudorhodoplanes sp.]|nr:methylenetetrahydrofolate reductase [Pseudorhodoplanes sp.]
MTVPHAVRPAGRFAQVIRDGVFAITAEISPPVSADKADLLNKVLPLKGLADAVNVTDGAGARAHMSAASAAAFMVECGVEPILQFTCRDRNRIALQSDLLGAAASGVRNVMILRGDDPAKGDQPDAKPVFDYDTRELIGLAARMRDAGELPSGRRIATPPGFFIGAADMPLDPQPGWSPQALRAKCEAGAQFVQTQFCMDAALVARYVARLREEGLVPRLAVLIGVAPLRSARSARWIRDNLFGSVIPEAIVARLDAASDPAAEGAAICVDLIAELAAIDGVAGVHVMAPGHDEIVSAVIEKVRARLG